MTFWTVLLAIALAVACDTQSESANVTIVPREERHILEYKPIPELREAAKDIRIPTREVSVSQFVESLAPIISYREFGLGIGNEYESDDDAGEAIKIWLRENTFATELLPSPYLLAMMNLVVYPPPQFGKDSLLRDLREQVDESCLGSTQDSNSRLAHNESETYEVFNNDECDDDHFLESTDIGQTYFLQHRDRYIHLLQEWIDYNNEQKPKWLSFRD